MPRRSRLPAAAALVIGLAVSSGARSGAPTTVEGVDVVAPAPLKAPPSRPAVEAFVGAIGVTALTGQLATWSPTALPIGASSPLGAAADSLAGQTICPQIMGLPAAYADFIVARLRKVGTALGAPVSMKDCPSLQNNLVIVFPADAPGFIRDLARDKPQAFGLPSHGALVQDLERPPEPIRAWYGVQTVVTESRASRLSLTHRSIIFQVLIVVDRDRTDDLNMGQMSDYLTLIALAQVRPDKIPPMAPSILNVFNDIAAGRAPAQGMTRMDAAYLQALYAVGARQPGELQNDQIATRVLHKLSRR
jgi:hypothetical protein